jgi:hypothetical protein
MRVSPWGRIVAPSALLVVGATAALIVGTFASTHERLVSYPVSGALSGVSFDLGDGDIVIVGGGRRDAVLVQRTERYAFGHDATATRSIEHGVFHVRSRCPSSVPERCSVRYRVTVPDNLPVEVHTTGGDVVLQDYRGTARVSTRAGDIDVGGFCGSSLDARAESGNVTAGTACAPPRLTLRATSGSVRAVVPAGRYQVDVESASGHETVRGVTATTDAPFSIQALSSSGDVAVQGRS